MDLTVAMCTYNPSQENILRALDAIVAQLGAVPSAELVVVDNNSRPPLAERRYLKGYPIRLIHEPKPGLTAARAAVVENARGDVIIFVDDDNVLGAGYIATVLDEFLADPALGLLGGGIVPEYDAAPPAWFAEFEPMLAVRRYPPDLRIETTAPLYTDYFPVGAGFAVRRSLARAHLDDCARTTAIQGRRAKELSSGEDIDLGLFVLSQGGKLAVIGSLQLTHIISSARLGIGYLHRLAAASAQSTLELERKWAGRFGQPVHPVPSLPLTRLLAATIKAAILSVFSRAHKIRLTFYLTVARARFRNARQSR